MPGSLSQDSPNDQSHHLEDCAQKVYHGSPSLASTSSLLFVLCRPDVEVSCTGLPPATQWTLPFGSVSTVISLPLFLLSVWNFAIQYCLGKTLRQGCGRTDC
ncbi:unnamed protein product [Victoria cruziana]